MKTKFGRTQLIMPQSENSSEKRELAGLAPCSSPTRNLVKTTRCGACFVFSRMVTWPPPVRNVARLSELRLRMPESESQATGHFQPAAPCQPIFGYETLLGTSQWAFPSQEAVYKLEFVCWSLFPPEGRSTRVRLPMNVIGRMILLAGLVITSSAYALESKLSYAHIFGGSIALILVIFVLFADD